MKVYQKILLKILYFIVTVLVLSVLAFYNKLPLLYPDSGTYLFNSSSLNPPVDKAMGYSLFIHLVTWQATTWTIVLFQNLIISWLIFMFLRLFFAGKRLYKFHVISIVILTMFTSLCWFSCLVMPDIFTPAMVLVIIIFIISEKLSLIHTIIYLSLLFIFLVSHLSHLLLLCFVLIPLLIFLFLRKKTQTTQRMMKQRCYMLIVTAVVSTLFLMTYNYRHGLGFKTSPTSNVLLTAKFCNTGILKRYLDDNCNSLSNCVLCQYKDSLPTSSDAFLWGNHSPLYHYNPPMNIDTPWLEANEAYAPIINGILSTPAYYPQLISDAIMCTWQQLIAIKVGTGKIPFGINSAPYYPYRDKFPGELDEFMQSRQNTGKLHFETVEIINRIAVLLSLLLIMLAVFYIKPDFTLWLSTAIIFLSLLGNALITSSLSVVEDRYQSRIIWLLPLLALVFLYKTLIKNKHLSVHES
ncbi:MAG: hypothetical protein WCL06_13940 [Bacteroidota bacterium]